MKLMVDFRRLVGKGFFLSLLCWVLHLPLQGQDLCNAVPPAGFTRFSPVVDKASICSDEQVTLGLGGVTNFTVYIGYQNQTLSELSTLPQSTTASFRISNPEVDDRNFTLLVIGERAGQRVIGCVNVLVRPIRSPRITYEGCGGDVYLFLDDPNNIALGSLSIDWNDGRSQVVNPSLQAVVKQSFLTIPIPPTRTFRIGPASGVLCGREVLIEVSMFGRDNYSILTDLTPDPDVPNRVSFVLNQGNRAAALGEYGLYIRQEGEAHQSIGDFFTKIQSGKNTVALPGEGPFCLVAYRNEYCPNNISNEICQTILDEVKVEGPRENQLFFTRPNTAGIRGLLPIIGLDTRVQASIESVRKFSSKEDVDLGVFQEFPIRSASPYADTEADCLKEPCYQLVWRTEGQIRSLSPLSRQPFTALSYSNIVCVDRATFPKPPVPNVRVSVLSDQQVQVYAEKPNATWPFEIVSFDIQDKITGINEFPWIDDAAQPAEASFCYHVRLQDECLMYSDWSEPACTIHLQSLPNNELIWSLQSPFRPGEISTFQVFFAENTNTGIEAQFTPVVNRHFPNLGSFEEFADYRIEAISTTGRASYSNTVRIPLQFNMFSPTAFSPNGDGINDTWGPKGRLIRLVRFDIVIATRTGQIIWQTNDPKASWDGTYKGQPAPAGSYSFQISVETTSESIQKSGTIQLIR